MVVISVISAKGGVGKTTVVSNVSTALVKFFSKKVLVIDGNISSPNLGFHFGMVSQENTLNEVLEEKIDITKAIYIHPSGVHIITSSLNVSSEPHDLSNFERKIEKIKNNYDFIFIDGAAGIGNDVISIIESSDQVIIVSNPDTISILSSLKAKKISQILNVPIKGLVLNKVKNDKFELSREEIEELTSLRIIAQIPYDKKVDEAISKMMPVVLYDGKTRASSAFIEFAAQICGEVYLEREGILEKIKRFLELRKA